MTHIFILTIVLTNGYNLALPLLENLLDLVCLQFRQILACPALAVNGIVVVYASHDSNLQTCSGFLRIDESEAVWKGDKMLLLRPMPRQGSISKLWIWYPVDHGSRQMKLIH